MNLYNNYLPKTKIFSHILIITMNDELCETEKETIIYTIYDMINDKTIEKNIEDIHISIKWMVLHKKDLLHYYTRYENGIILGNNTILHHTKLILNDIKKIINKDKFSFCLLNHIQNQLLYVENV